MKKLLLLFVLFVLVGCSSNVENKDSEVRLNEEEVIKNELELLGLTYNQSIKFDEFVMSVSNSIAELQQFSFKVQNNYSGITQNDLTDVLLTTHDVESSYNANNGSEKKELLDFLQESPFGFYGIASNLFEYERAYTELEASMCLQSLLYYAKDLGKVYGLEGENLEKIGLYFLNNITVVGNFIPARDQMLLSD